MNPNLRRLLGALYLELERLDWEDKTALQSPPPSEIDGSCFYVIDQNGLGQLSYAKITRYSAEAIEGDQPDETDYCNYPICVECGNFSPSCVC